MRDPDTPEIYSAAATRIAFAARLRAYAADVERHEPAQLIPHHPFWCEENIWHLAQHPAPGPGERLVIVITGAETEFVCWHQHSGRNHQPVSWNYHVVMAVRSPRWSIWDLDTRLGYPVPAHSYLNTTFPSPEQLPAAFHPRFALFPAAQWIAGFGSDRSHMRTPEGAWQHDPPPWPPISGQTLTLATAIARARAGLDLAALRSRLIDGELSPS